MSASKGERDQRFLACRFFFGTPLTSSTTAANGLLFLPKFPWGGTAAKLLLSHLAKNFSMLAYVCWDIGNPVKLLCTEKAWSAFTDAAAGAGEGPSILVVMDDGPHIIS